jgi:hypothetical protein
MHEGLLRDAVVARCVVSNPDWTFPRGAKAGAFDVSSMGAARQYGLRCIKAAEVRRKRAPMRDLHQSEG